MGSIGEEKKNKAKKISYPNTPFQLSTQFETFTEALFTFNKTKIGDFEKFRAKRMKTKKKKKDLELRCCDASGMGRANSREPLSQNGERTKR